MTTKLELKPSVYKLTSGHWVAELDWISWTDTSYFDSWEDALEHALWLGQCAGVWK